MPTRSSRSHSSSASKSRSKSRSGSRRRRSSTRSRSRSPDRRKRRSSPVRGRRYSPPARRGGIRPARRRSPISRRKSRSRSPRRRSRSPRRRSRSPRKRSRSPRKRSRSPRKRSRSPRKRSTSPRKRSNSPRKKSRSPRKKSAGSRSKSRSGSKSSVRSESPHEVEEKDKKTIPPTVGHGASGGSSEKKGDAKSSGHEPKRRRFTTAPNLEEGEVEGNDKDVAAATPAISSDEMLLAKVRDTDFLAMSPGQQFSYLLHGDSSKRPLKFKELYKRFSSDSAGGDDEKFEMNEAEDITIDITRHRLSTSHREPEPQLPKHLGIARLHIARGKEEGKKPIFDREELKFGLQQDIEDGATVERRISVKVKQRGERGVVGGGNVSTSDAHQPQIVYRHRSLERFREIERSHQRDRSHRDAGAGGSYEVVQARTAGVSGFKSAPFPFSDGSNMMAPGYVDTEWPRRQYPGMQQRHVSPGDLRHRITPRRLPSPGKLGHYQYQGDGFPPGAFPPGVHPADLRQGSPTRRSARGLLSSVGSIKSGEETLPKFSERPDKPGFEVTPQTIMLNPTDVPRGGRFWTHDDRGDGNTWSRGRGGRGMRGTARGRFERGGRWDRDFDSRRREDVGASSGRFGRATSLDKWKHDKFIEAEGGADGEAKVIVEENVKDDSKVEKEEETNDERREWKREKVVEKQDERKSVGGGREDRSKDRGIRNRRRSGERQTGDRMDRSNEKRRERSRERRRGERKRDDDKSRERSGERKRRERSRDRGDKKRADSRDRGDKKRADSRDRGDKKRENSRDRGDKKRADSRERGDKKRVESRGKKRDDVKDKVRDEKSENVDMAGGDAKTDITQMTEDMDVDGANGSNVADTAKVPLGSEGEITSTT